MNIEPTVPQRCILDFLEERSANGEAPPTYREICVRFGYRSPKAAADHVAALERKGLLVREKGCARGLRLVKKATGVPVLGRVPAGSPREAWPEMTPSIPLDPTFF